MSFAAKHTSALAAITKNGAAVTFSRVTQGSYDAATDTATPATSTVSGYAIRVSGDQTTRGNPDRYSQLGLVESKAPTLLFAASTYGSVPELGATCSWNSETFTVRDVNPIAPDGTPIVSYVVISE